MRRPCITTSSPVLTMAVISDWGRTCTSPLRKRAAPTPPARTVITGHSRPPSPDGRSTRVPRPWRPTRARRAGGDRVRREPPAGLVSQHVFERAREPRRRRGGRRAEPRRRPPRGAPALAATTGKVVLPRLEHRKPEPLVERRIGEHRRRSQQRRPLAVVDETHRADTLLCRGGQRLDRVADRGRIGAVGPARTSPRRVGVPRPRQTPAPSGGGSSRASNVARERINGASGTRVAPRDRSRRVAHLASSKVHRHDL